MNDCFYCFTGRSPRGERGLKFTKKAAFDAEKRRSPRGERGLKFFELSVLGLLIGVALLAESVD